MVDINFPQLPGTGTEVLDGHKFHSRHHQGRPTFLIPNHKNFPLGIPPPCLQQGAIQVAERGRRALLQENDRWGHGNIYVGMGIRPII